MGNNRTLSNKMEAKGSSIEIYRSEEGGIELKAEATCAKFAQVRREGKRQVAKFATPKNYGRHQGMEQTQIVEYYNLEDSDSKAFPHQLGEGLQMPEKEIEDAIGGDYNEE